MSDKKGASPAQSEHPHQTMPNSVAMPQIMVKIALTFAAVIPGLVHCLVQLWDHEFAKQRAHFSDVLGV